MTRKYKSIIETARKHLQDADPTAALETLNSVTRKPAIITGDKIRELRGARSQEEFGDLIGASQAMVSNYENDRARPPRAVLMHLQAMITSRQSHPV